MMKHSKLFIIGLLLNLICNSSYCEEGKELSKEDLFRIFEGKLKELNLPLIDMDKIRFSTFDAGVEKRGGKEVWNAACLHGGVTMDMELNTGKVIHFGNWANVNKIEENSFKEEPKPTKTQEEMIKEGEKYIKILSGNVFKDIRFWHAEFNEPFTEGLKPGYHRDGEWTIIWQRSEGSYMYLNDGISMGINEKYGLSGYGYNLFSQYHPPKQINISKEKSISIAKKNINKIIRSPLTSGWYDGYKIGKVVNVELMIVNPNYLHIPRKDYNPTPQPYARLAWIVGFQSVDIKMNKAGSINCAVWIDAETGEVLGGG